MGVAMRRAIIGLITGLCAVPASGELDQQISGLDFLKSAHTYLTVVRGGGNTLAELNEAVDFLEFVLHVSRVLDSVKRTCTPNVKNAELADKVANFAVHRQDLSQRPGLAIAVAALQEAYPCKK
jgi:hypothetical protein